MKPFIPNQQRGDYIMSPRFILKIKHLPQGAKNLFFSLCHFARSKNYCFPSQTKLAEEIGACVNSVKAWLKELVKQGFVKIVQSDSGKNIYYLYCPTDLGKIEQEKPSNHDKDEPYFDSGVSNHGYKENNIKNIKLTPYSPPQNSHSQTPPNKKSIGSVDFENFWKEYPRKENKEKARQAFEKARRYKSLPLIEDFKNAILYFYSMPQWQRNEGRFIPQFHNFMNDKRWEEVPKKESPKEVVAAKPIDFEEENKRMDEIRLERQKNEEIHQMLKSAWEEFSSYFKPDTNKYNKFTAQRLFFNHYREKNELIQVNSQQNITAYEYIGGYA